MPRADAAALRYCCMKAPIAVLSPPPRGAVFGRVHGVPLASFLVIMSACACVIWPLLTSSASVSATGFLDAALMSAWLLPLSTAKCFMKRALAVGEDGRAETAA